MNEKIWISKENNEKYKKGDPEILKLTNKEVNKFPKSIMVAGGISYYGLSDLLVLEGTMNEFSYAQAILYYKENLDELKKKIAKFFLSKTGQAVTPANQMKIY